MTRSIWLESDLLTDPRMVRFLRNASALQGVTHITQALGCFAHLWMIAGAHIGDDDILPMGADEIDQVIGVQGFCQCVPEDWLQILDPHHVKLPGYQAHNGPDARKRAKTRARVSNHRATRNAKALPSVTGNASAFQVGITCNAKGSLPLASPSFPKRYVGVKQELKPKNPTPSISPPPFDPSTVPGLDVKAWADWVAYRKARQPSLKAPSMPKAAAFMAAMGAGQRAAVDFSISQGYQGLMEPKSAVAAKVAPDKSPLWAEARARANAINFRAPGSLESPESYMTAVKFAESNYRSGSMPLTLAAGIQGLAQRLVSR